MYKNASEPSSPSQITPSTSFMLLANDLKLSSTRNQRLSDKPYVFSPLVPIVRYLYHIKRPLLLYLFNTEIVQKRLCCRVGDELFFSLQPLSHRGITPTLLLLQWQMFIRVTSIDPPAHAFTARSGQVMFTMENHPSSLRDLLVISPNRTARTVTLDHRLPRGYFNGHYNLNLFKFRMNRYISYI